MDPSCPLCRCSDPGGAAMHAVLDALGVDDLDRAIDAGLLDITPCSGCSGECTARLLVARETRLRALAARERYRARQARLQQRAEERASTRAPVPADSIGSNAAAPASRAVPALPSAAAAALARARARAAERHKP